MPLVRNHVTTDPPPAVPVNAPASAIQPGGLEAQRVQTLQLLRCIESLAQFTGHAASILKDLHAQVHSAAAQSSSSLAQRTADLAAATSTLQSAPVDAYLTAKPIRLSDPTPSPLFGFLTRATRPTSIQSSLSQCTAPPQLDLLDPHRDDGKKCMSFYSDPEFFAEEWRKVMAKEDEERRKRKKARKQKQMEEKQKLTGAGGKDGGASSLARNKSLRGAARQQQQQQQQQQGAVGTGTASRASLASNVDAQAMARSNGSMAVPGPGSTTSGALPTSESSASLARAGQPGMPRSESSSKILPGTHDSMALPPPPPPPMDGSMGMPRVPSNLGAFDTSALPPPPPPTDAFAGTHVPPPPPPPPAPPVSSGSGAPPPPPPPPPSIGLPAPPSAASGSIPPPPPPPMSDASSGGGAPSLAALVLQAPKLRPAAARATPAEGPNTAAKAGDGIDSVLTSIKAGGFQLRKVEKPVGPPPKKSPVEEYGNDVAGILMRRAAIEMSDSDEDESESDDDDDW
ncbi:hypothetical protein BCR44DRAFT_1485978 [Catenaria anguillulae PL171]|uniref:WASP family protein member n=1 Tax=Catenaria anguillulae PL171 TaxID=765915 RepID=A0A1Y2HIQ1_9FUNG|nr:hypothetical protein BCR44DRAFT_1485978 [Catenaria anguillulae PL171]